MSVQTDNKYIFKAEKLIVNKIKGFTLIELLFVLQIIGILELFILPYTQKKIELREIEIHNIYFSIENARLDAINEHQSVTLKFSNHEITQSGMIIYENENLVFDDEFEITFNHKGHIRQAKTIKFCINQINYQLVFNLGQGVYRIEKV